MNEYIVYADGYHAEKDCFGMWCWVHYRGIAFRVTAATAAEACNKIKAGGMLKYRYLSNIHTKEA